MLQSISQTAIFIDIDLWGVYPSRVKSSKTNESMFFFCGLIRSTCTGIPALEPLKIALTSLSRIHTACKSASRLQPLSACHIEVLQERSQERGGVAL